MPQAPGGVLSVRLLNRALPERQMLLRRRCECQGVLLRKFLITLLSAPPERAFRAPYTSPDKDFTILRVTDGTVFIIVTVAEGKRFELRRTRCIETPGATHFRFEVVR